MTPRAAEVIAIADGDRPKAEDRNGDTPHTGAAAIDESTIVTLEEFIAVDEPGAEPLLGDSHGALIPEGGDVMAYGDGGAGKTTLMFDLACHLATGEDWLGIPVPRPVRLLLIENEGPRPQLRNKLKHKVLAWQGPELDGRISIFERPWGRFTFAETDWRELLAAAVNDRRVDVIIAGPLTRLGMEAAGTLQEVVAFMRLVDDVRLRCQRHLTVILVHHENKGGAVSGAWEGAGDTLLHVQAAGNGHTVVFIQKARWASAHHHQTLKLAWTAGDSFELEGDRDYVGEVVELLSDGQWRAVKDIAAKKDAEQPGIGASETTVKKMLEGNPERFELRTKDAAKALGYSHNAKLWGLRSSQNADDADSLLSALPGGAESVSASASPLKDADTPNAPPNPTDESALPPELRDSDIDWETA